MTLEQCLHCKFCCFYDAGDHYIAKVGVACKKLHDTYQVKAEFDILDSIIGKKICKIFERGNPKLEE